MVLPGSASEIGRIPGRIPLYLATRNLVLTLGMPLLDSRVRSYGAVLCGWRCQGELSYRPTRVVQSSQYEGSAWCYLPTRVVPNYSVLCYLPTRALFYLPYHHSVFMLCVLCYAVLVPCSTQCTNGACYAMRTTGLAAHTMARGGAECEVHVWTLGLVRAHCEAVSGTLLSSCSDLSGSVSQYSPTPSLMCPVLTSVLLLPGRVRAIRKQEERGRGLRTCAMLYPVLTQLLRPKMCLAISRSDFKLTVPFQISFEDFGNIFRSLFHDWLDFSEYQVGPLSLKSNALSLNSLYGTSLAYSAMKRAVQKHRTALCAARY
eukprot:2019581-Rhodomonas_salina.2